jgi:hypothetical protein
LFFGKTKTSFFDLNFETFEKKRKIKEVVLSTTQPFYHDSAFFMKT